MWVGRSRPDAVADACAGAGWAAWMSRRARFKHRRHPLVVGGDASWRAGGSVGAAPLNADTLRTGACRGRQACPRRRRGYRRAARSRGVPLVEHDDRPGTRCADPLSQALVLCVAPTVASMTSNGMSARSSASRAAAPSGARSPGRLGGPPPSRRCRRSRAARRTSRRRLSMASRVSGHVVDDGALLADHAVEEGRLPTLGRPTSATRGGAPSLASAERARARRQSRLPVGDVRSRAGWSHLIEEISSATSVQGADRPRVADAEGDEVPDGGVAIVSRLVDDEADRDPNRRITLAPRVLVVTPIVTSTTSRTTSASPRPSPPAR